jgi:hypothetical protein
MSCGHSGNLLTRRRHPLLDGGERPPEQDLVRLLRAPACSPSLVERLAGCRWVLRERRVLPLVVRHPACPRAFALEGAGRLGWHDLLEVARDPRRLVGVASGLLDHSANGARQRIALARLATGGNLGLLLAPTCGAFQRSGPGSSGDAVACFSSTSGRCVLAVLRHPRWGTVPLVVRRHCGTASRSASLGSGQLVRISPMWSRPDVPH